MFNSSSTLASGSAFDPNTSPSPVPGASTSIRPSPVTTSMDTGNTTERRKVPKVKRLSITGLSFSRFIDPDHEPSPRRTRSITNNRTYDIPGLSTRPGKGTSSKPRQKKKKNTSHSPNHPPLSPALSPSAGGNHTSWPYQVPTQVGWDQDVIMADSDEATAQVRSPKRKARECLDEDEPTLTNIASPVLLKRRKIKQDQPHLACQPAASASGVVTHTGTSSEPAVTGPAIPLNPPPSPKKRRVKNSACPERSLPLLSSPTPPISSSHSAQARSPPHETPPPLPPSSISSPKTTRRRRVPPPPPAQPEPQPRSHSQAHTVRSTAASMQLFAWTFGAYCVSSISVYCARQTMLGG